MDKKSTIWSIEKFFSPTFYTINRPHSKVMWLSHHIPKTAGSSLRDSFNSSLRPSRVFGAYASSGAPELTQGKGLWLPNRCSLLHGHYRPHPNHKMIFPNAKKIVWVRDPVERLYSLVRHLLQVQGDHPQYLLLKRAYLDNGVIELGQIVEDMITNKTLPKLTEAYSSFFSKVSIDEFDFVGSIHNYPSELVRLSKLMNLNLTEAFKNVRAPNKTSIHNSALKPYLSKEYEIVERYL